MRRDQFTKPLFIEWLYIICYYLHVKMKNKLLVHKFNAFANLARENSTSAFRQNEIIVYDSLEQLTPFNSKKQRIRKYTKLLPKNWSILNLIFNEQQLTIRAEGKLPFCHHRRHRRVGLNEDASMIS